MQSTIERVFEHDMNGAENLKCAAAIQAWRDMGNDYGRIQLVKQYFMCIEGKLLDI